MKACSEWGQVNRRKGFIKQTQTTLEGEFLQTQESKWVVVGGWRGHEYLMAYRLPVGASWQLTEEIAAGTQPPSPEHRGAWGTVEGVVLCDQEETAGSRAGGLRVTSCGMCPLSAFSSTVRPEAKASTEKWVWGGGGGHWSLEKRGHVGLD